MRLLREDQSEALEQLRVSVGKGNRRLVMKAPTGFGKTVLAAALVESARAKGKRVLFTVPAIALVDQTVEMFVSQGIHDVGVIQADHPMTDWSQPVQIASVQTLQRRQLPQADVVLIDECQVWFKFYETWLRAVDWKDIPIIGLSATPWTKGLGAYYEDLIVASTTQELIEAGLLSPFKVFAPSHPDLRGVRTIAGDYHEGELSTRMQDGTLVADIVSTWLKHGENRPTLCFAVDCDHAQHLKNRFEAAGVGCAYQDANTKSAERKAIKKGFHDGSIKVVCSVGTLLLGVDWDVRCEIIARPTKSSMLFVQMIGRALRTAPGKDHALLLDHSDNHLRLGFVTDVDAAHVSLHNGRTPIADEKDRVRLPKECPKCAFLKPPRTAVCPNCQHKVEAHARVVEPAKGELGELKKPVFTMSEKLFFFRELKCYEKNHSYKTGWASNKYREKFGVWPDNSFRDVAPAGMVSAKTAGWIKSRQIAWAKSQRRPYQPHDGGHVNGGLVLPPTKPDVPVSSGTLMTREDFEVDL